MTYLVFQLCTHSPCTHFFSEVNTFFSPGFGPVSFNPYLKGLTSRHGPQYSCLAPKSLSRSGGPGLEGIGPKKPFGNPIRCKSVHTLGISGSGTEGRAQKERWEIFGNPNVLGVVLGLRGIHSSRFYSFLGPSSGCQ